MMKSEYCFLVRVTLLQKLDSRIKLNFEVFRYRSLDVFADSHVDSEVHILQVQSSMFQLKNLRVFERRMHPVFCLGSLRQLSCVPAVDQGIDESGVYNGILNFQKKCIMFLHSLAANLETVICVGNGIVQTYTSP